MLLVFEFLIRTENIIYILTVVKDLFKDLGQVRLYYHSLEPFIQKRLI
jgi:hypothetical protein